MMWLFECLCDHFSKVGPFGQSAQSVRLEVLSGPPGWCRLGVTYYRFQIWHVMQALTI